MKKIYISGPMTGLPEFNFPVFHAEAARIRALGFDVVNPAELNPDHDTPRNECLKADLKALPDCDTLALLPGWQNSRGAMLELQVAHNLGLKIILVDEIGPEPMDMILRRAVFSTVQEIQSAIKKFPTWPTDPLHALAVLGEEFGELTKSVLQCTPPPSQGHALPSSPPCNPGWLASANASQPNEQHPPVLFEPRFLSFASGLCCSWCFLTLMASAM